jgi:acetolactate synthase-1/2/3 large subunit
MQVSDYIIQFFEGKGTGHIFLVTGGGAMYMNDALGRSGKIRYVACLHEQAAGIAAEAYARVTNRPGVLMVTSGPGGTNALTPVAAAYIESTPLVVLSGQVKRDDMINGQGVRQMGMQEADIIAMARPVTKYAVTVLDPNSIRYHLERAWEEAVSGRPGPVWLDVPLDVQSWELDPEGLSGYTGTYTPPEPSADEITAALELLKNARRPCLMLGNGVRLAGAAARAEGFAEKLELPVMTSWNGIDLIGNDHPLFAGRPGAVGQRAATIVQQNCDCLLTVGVRMNLLQTGFNYDAFARAATHIMVDIDGNELRKMNVRPALAVQADAGVFMEKLSAALDETALPDYGEWKGYCQKIRERYPVMTGEYRVAAAGTVNSYRFVNALSRVMENDDIYVATSSGSALDVAMQVFEVKKGQRVFATKGLASMGFDLPAAIGACLAGGGRRTVCVTGDGGFQMNVQELETLRRLGLPVKIFVLDNGGYAMIRNSHVGAFDGRLTACTPESGLTLPDVLRQADVYGIPAAKITGEGDLVGLGALIAGDRPLVCRVTVDIAQKLIPRQRSYRNKAGRMESLPIEEMNPPLGEDEMNEAMLIGRYKQI